MRDEVFLTGATGFVGGHVLRALLARGYRVRALVRHPQARNRAELDGKVNDLEACTIVEGDLRQPGPLARAMDGCRYLVHTAALYSFHPRRRADIVATNVRGTSGLLEAARIAGVERVVMTSSSATLEQGLTGNYHRSKAEQERVALAAQGPVVFILPTAPVGAGDGKPTPTGQIIVDFMRGRIFGSLPGGMNVVNVEDVAEAHVLALQRGDPGERYVIGGENLTFDDLWAKLSRATGRKAPGWRVPYGLAFSLGVIDDLRCRFFPAARPSVPLEGVRMARRRMFADSAAAQATLGFRSRSVDDALDQAVAWYRAHAYA